MATVSLLLPFHTPFSWQSAFLLLLLFLLEKKGSVCVGSRGLTQNCYSSRTLTAVQAPASLYLLLARGLGSSVVLPEPFFTKEGGSNGSGKERQRRQDGLSKQRQRDSFLSGLNGHCVPRLRRQSKVHIACLRIFSRQLKDK